MKKKYKIIVIVFISIFLYTCSKIDSQKDTPNISKSLEIIDTLIVYNSSDGDINWKLYADRLKKFNYSNMEYFSNIKLELFNKNSDISTLIYADSAIINDKKNTIEANGNIRIYSEKGDLFTNSLIWDRNEKRIYSNEKVKVIKDDNTIWGDRFESDDHFKHVILHKASAEGKIDEQQKIW